MPSPFPGVDPYIEACGRWLGFHNVFIANCAQLLNRLLPSHYAANVEERIELVDAPAQPGRQVLPDIGVTRDPLVVAAAGQAVAPAATIEPEVLTLPAVIEAPEAYIEIVEVPSHELVTGIEVLSPTNKSADRRGEYLAKRYAMLRRDVNLVEIDLLVGGHRLEMVEPLPAGDAYVFVSRADQRPRCKVYPWGIRQSLPVIPIPLKPPDPDVSVDLGLVFTATFDGGRYDRTLRYGEPPPAGLRSADRVWAAERARAAETT